jgi:WhiB family redox-sensing transcriptional regulator
VTITGTRFWSPKPGTGSEWMDWMTPAWYADALCREYPHLHFVPRRGEPTELLEAVCRHCLVRQQCLTYALRDDSLVGIWGATSAPERAELRRRSMSR